IRMEIAAPSTPRTSSRGRRFSVAAVIVAAAMILSACLTPEQESVLNELNADRRANRLSTLGTHSQAQAKAQAWAEKLASEGKLYHSNLGDGMSGWCNLGENVGYG